MRAIPIVALDVANTTAALSIVDTLGDLCRFYKVGSELFTAEGPTVISHLRDRGCDVFLDLKYHDIPNTIRGAVRSACALGVRLLTVHASGGREMLDAAVEGAAGRCGVLGVTVLTSMDSASLGEMWGRSVTDVHEEVLRLAGAARRAGLNGIVCSGEEAAEVHSRHGDMLEVLVPGVRLAGGDVQDQKRVVTPAQAVAAGASYIVIGRSVTSAPDPRAAMAEVRSAVD
jgi:orotidine-5'-phosphate decarboxylase